MDMGKIMLKSEGELDICYKRRKKNNIKSKQFYMQACLGRRQR